MGGKIVLLIAVSLRRAFSIPQNRETPTIRARSGRDQLGSTIRTALEAPLSPELSTMAPTTPTEADVTPA